MPTFRVRFVVDWGDGAMPSLPLAPVRSDWVGVGVAALEFDAEGDTFDGAAGRLWGEIAACGLHVRSVGPDRRLRQPAH